MTSRPAFSDADPTNRPEVLRARLATWRTALPFEDAYHKQLLTDAIYAIGRDCARKAEETA